MLTIKFSYMHKNQMDLKFLNSSGPLNWGRKKAKHVLNLRTNNDGMWTVNRREKSIFYPNRFTKEIMI